MNRVFAFLLCVGHAFSMERPFWEDFEKAGNLMRKLVNDTIYAHELPDQERIQSVACECFNLLGRCTGATMLGFSYQLPEDAMSFPDTARLLDALGEAFHDELIQLPKQN